MQTRYRLKWVAGIVVGMLVIAGIAVPGIYFGMFIKTESSRSSFIFRSWGLSFLRHNLGFVPNYLGSITAKPEHIDIDIKHKNFQKIAFKRRQAIQEGYLFASDDDWIPAKIRYKNQTYRIDMRLKGDCIDHWEQEEAWSFKIKVKDDKTLFGMKKFAIQHPWTRNYLVEWFFHKMLHHNGLIALRYDFIEVAINGKLQPIYAIEENFEKRLLEHNQKREGVILSFDTDYLWYDHLWHNRAQKYIPLLDSAIDAYQMKKIKSDKTLYDQFNTGKNLFEKFRQQRLSVAQVFDQDKLARFFAILDLTGCNHSAHLTNMKFYYNPVTSLLEPIGYDNENLVSLNSPYDLCGVIQEWKPNLSQESGRTDWIRSLFSDREFFEHYITVMEEFSQKEFLDNFFAAISNEYHQKLKILHKSYPWYFFEGKSTLYENQQYIRGLLAPAKAVDCYLNQYSPANNQLTLTLRNIHFLPIEVLNISTNDSLAARPLQETILQQRSETEPVCYQQIKFDLPQDCNWTDSTIDLLKLAYRIPGSDKIGYESIYPWPAEDRKFLEKDFIRAEANIRDFEFISIDDENKNIYFNKGDFELSKSLIIPKGYTVFCYPGTSLNLSRSAKILSYSPLVFIGSPEEPVLIKSDDKTGQGLVVIKASQESQLEYVVFENLTNPAQNGWRLTGAVTFYESPVNISSCRFLSSRSEDGLNIIRSEFSIADSFFKHSASDSLDADFCKGTITNLSFVDSANDAIDVSGSVIELR